MKKLILMLTLVLLAMFNTNDANSATAVVDCKKQCEGAKRVKSCIRKCKRANNASLDENSVEVKSSKFVKGKKLSKKDKRKARRAGRKEKRKEKKAARKEKRADRKEKRKDRKAARKEKRADKKSCKAECSRLSGKAKRKCKKACRK